MGIGENIPLLIKTQELDTQIYNLRKNSRDKPKELESLKEELQAKKDELTKVEQSLRSFQLKRKDKELELEKGEENIKKYQIQLYQIKSNKEYKSLLTEIEGLKADNSVLEEEIILLLDEVEGANKKVSQKKEDLKLQENRLKETEQMVKNEITQINAQLDKLNEERGKLVSQIKSSILAKYEHILQNKNGLAMVQVINGACGGCHMDVPTQVINEIRMKDDLIICENCSRILYLAE